MGAYVESSKNRPPLADPPPLRAPPVLGSPHGRGEPIPARPRPAHTRTDGVSASSNLLAIRTAEPAASAAGRAHAGAPRRSAPVWRPLQDLMGGGLSGEPPGTCSRTRR